MCGTHRVCVELARVPIGGIIDSFMGGVNQIFFGDYQHVGATGQGTGACNAPLQRNGEDEGNHQSLNKRDATAERQLVQSSLDFRMNERPMKWALHFRTVTAKLTPLGFGLDRGGPLLFQVFETSVRLMTETIEQLQALLCFQKIGIGLIESVLVELLQALQQWLERFGQVQIDGPFAIA